MKSFTAIITGLLIAAVIADPAFQCSDTRTGSKTTLDFNGY